MIAGSITVAISRVAGKWDAISFDAPKWNIRLFFCRFERIGWVELLFNASANTHGPLFEEFDHGSILCKGILEHFPKFYRGTQNGIKNRISNFVPRAHDARKSESNAHLSFDSLCETKDDESRYRRARWGGYQGEGYIVNGIKAILVRNQDPKQNHQHKERGTSRPDR